MNKWISTILLALVICFAVADSTNFPFKVTDDVTPIQYVKLSVSSSDTNFIPNKDLSVEGVGVDKLLFVKYDLSKSGVSKITVAATDEAQKTTESSFTFAIHPPPTLKIKRHNNIPILYWDSVSNYTYKLYIKNSVAGPWSNFCDVTASGPITYYTNETEGVQGFFKLGY